MRNWMSRYFEKRRLTLPRDRDEVRLDREQSRQIHGQPAVLGVESFTHGVLPMEGAPAQCQDAGQRGVERTGGGDSTAKPGQLWSTPYHRAVAPAGAPRGAGRVRRSLKRQGLRPVYRKGYVVTTDSAHRMAVAPNLLDRRFDGWHPDQAWVGDITYAATGEGWLYLAEVMDLGGRRLVGWSMSSTIDAALVCPAFRLACWQCKPAAGLLVHTDRDSQYASHDYRELARQFGIRMSMSGRANCWRQCGNGELLQDSESRENLPSMLQHLSSGPLGYRGLDRGLLQPDENSLGQRVLDPGL